MFWRRKLPTMKEIMTPNSAPRRSEITNKVMSTVEVIEEIHNSFENASERLLKEAQEIINTPIDTNCELKLQLGFSNAKGVVETKEKVNEREAKKKLLESLNYLSLTYPQYKFIHHEQVMKICEKYNLIMGDCSAYTGDIPTKNLQEIAQFNKNIVKEEDCIYTIERRNYSSGLKEMGYSINKLQICAPIKDMKIKSNQVVVNNQIVNIPDPIVLFPVKDNFYIIVSKWGLEGEDESLTNEKMN